MRCVTMLQGLLITSQRKLSSTLNCTLFFLLHTAQHRNCPPSSSLSSSSVSAVLLIVLTCSLPFLLFFVHIKVVSSIPSRLEVKRWDPQLTSSRIHRSSLLTSSVCPASHWRRRQKCDSWTPVRTMWPAMMDLRISIHWINAHPGNLAHCGLHT